MSSGWRAATTNELLGQFDMTHVAGDGNTAVWHGHAAGWRRAR